MRGRAALLPVLIGSLAAGAVMGFPPPEAEPTPAPPATALDAGLISELEAIDAKAAGVVDLRATFEQTKKTVLLKKPLVSAGTVLVKGRTIRWNTTKPRPSVLLVNDEEIRVYYPEQKSVEVYTVDESMRRLTASPLPRLASIREQFIIARLDPAALDPGAAGRTHVALSLVPRDEGVRRHVSEVRVLLNREGALAERIELSSPDGERTSIVFRDARINDGVTAQELELELPAGTRVSRPLGRAPAKESP